MPAVIPANNLEEVIPESLDILVERINQKLIKGLPLEVSDADLDAFVRRLQADRKSWLQRDAELAAKPKRTRAKASTKLTAEAEDLLKGLVVEEPE